MNIPANLENRCNLLHTQFDAITNVLNASLDENRFILERAEALMSFARRMMPNRADYQEALCNQYIMSQLYSRSDILQNAYENNKPILLSETEEMLSFWTTHPAFYMTFRIAGRKQPNLFEIEDMSSGECYLFLSPGLEDLQNKKETRNAHYLALMLDNGLCLQSIGLIHHNRLQYEDITFACRVLDEQLFTERGLDGVLKEKPEVLYFFDFVSSIPPIVTQGRTMELQYAYVDEVSYRFHAPVWIMEEKDGGEQYILDKPDQAMIEEFGPSTIFDTPGIHNMRVFKQNGRFLVMAFNEEAFVLLCRIIGHPILKPLHRLSVPLVLQLEKEYPMPWTPFLLTGDAGHAQAPENKEIARLNKVMGRYINALNSGKDFNVEAEARKEQVDPVLVREFISQLGNTMQKHKYQVPTEEEQYELEGWPVPPPTVRRAFGDSLYDSSLFMIQESEQMEEQFHGYTQDRYRKEVDREGLIGCIENLFLDEFEDMDLGYTALNTLLWILLHSGDKPLLVRSLGLEIFKLFPLFIQVYSLEEFIELLSKVVIICFIQTSLCTVTERPRGEKRKRGLYSIQASPFLRTLISLIPYSV